jgi:hypothetical protein
MITDNTRDEGEIKPKGEVIATIMYLRHAMMLNSTT